MYFDQKDRIIFKKHVRLLQLDSLITLGLLVLIIITHSFVSHEFGKEMWKTIGLSRSTNALKNLFPIELLCVSVYGIILVAKVIFKFHTGEVFDMILTGFVFFIIMRPYCLLRDVNSKAFEFAENFQNLTNSEESIIKIGPAKVNSALKAVNAHQISDFCQKFKIHFQEKVSPLYKTHCTLCAACCLCYFITSVIHYQVRDEKRDFMRFNPEIKRRQLHNKYKDPVFKTEPITKEE